MDFLCYTINQVFIDSNGQVQDKTIKQTWYKEEAESFLKLAKELKPQDKFYMFESLTD